MPSDNRIILACAGSGKSTSIVDDACADTSRKAALVTYTINGASELSKIACERHRAVPSHVMIGTWYTTNDSSKNKEYARAKIMGKFKQWEAAGHCEIKFQTESRRCVQEICNFADRLFPDFQKTLSLNTAVTGHDGVFAVERRHVADYCSKFNPQTLRYNRTFEDVVGSPINFGAAKGMTFDRTLV